MRGWPTTFFAIQQATSDLVAWLVLAVIFAVGGIFVVNMFPAIFIFALKQGDERDRKIFWLELFPGDKKNVSEFELMVWANANESYLLQADAGRNQDGFLTILYNGIMALVYMVIPRPKAKKEFIDPELLDEEYLPRKKIFCIPRCSRCPKLRSIVMDDQSAFNQFIIAVILMNIFVLSADTYRTPADGRVVIQTLNSIFTVIFAAEVVIKIIVMGPCLYFDNGFNMMDFSLVALSLPSFFIRNFHFINSFRVLRILRLLRLLRLARMVRVIKTIYDADTSEIIEYILPSKLFAIIMDFSTPATNVLLYIFILCFVFAILGMELLYPYRKPQIDVDPIMTHFLETPGAAHISDLELQWGGKYLHQMNFDCFGNGYVTAFNLVNYNNWYLLMVDTIRRGTSACFIYYFVFLVLASFIPISTLLAAVTSIMEQNAHSLLKEKAEKNKMSVERVGGISLLAQVRTVFRLLQKNTMELNKDSVSAASKPVTRPAINDVYEPPAPGSIIREFITNRQKYPLYLFSPRGNWRKLCVYLQSDIFFQIAVTVSTVETVVSTVTNQSETLLPAYYWNLANYIATIVFLVEMGVKWVCYGLFMENGYFKDPMSYIDFTVNFAMTYALTPAGATLGSGIKILRIARLIKIPNAIKFLVKSRALKGLLVAIEASSYSIGSVTVVVSIMSIFFSVVGINLFSSHYGHCSNSAFPGGMHRNHWSDDFPHGCNYQTATGEPIHWINATLDSYDDIFTATKATFRVMGNNEFQGIMYDTLNAIGQPGYQPVPFHNRSAFLFFLVLSIVALTFSVLTVAIVYYHYVLTVTTAGRKSIFGENAAFWVSYEVSLCCTSTFFFKTKMSVNFELFQLLKG